MIGVVIRSIDERGDQVMISIRCFSRIPLKDRDQESVEQRCFLRRRVDIMIMVPVSLFADFGKFQAVHSQPHRYARQAQGEQNGTTYGYPKSNFWLKMKTIRIICLLRGQPMLTDPYLRSKHIA